MKTAHIVIAAAAAFLLLSRPARAGAQTRYVQQIQGTQPADRFTQVAQAVTGIFGAIAGGTRASTTQTYGNGAVSGITMDWLEQQVAIDAAAWNAHVGTADDATGDPYHPGW